MNPGSRFPRPRRGEARSRPADRMRARRRTAAGGCVVAIVLLLSACGRDQPARLRVYAAASLTDVFTALAPRFDGIHLEPNFGGSSLLARQIRDGAPADVFVSASSRWTESLSRADKLEGVPVVIARNRLVCIASRRVRGERTHHDDAAVPAHASDAGALLHLLGEDGRVAIADEGVPAGEYARAALEHLGLLADFAPHLVGQADVRAVLRAVESGELDVGFVYATDAKRADVDVLFAFEPGTHPPIEYRACVIRDAPHPHEARRFLEFLRSGPVRELLADAGFGLP